MRLSPITRTLLAFAVLLLARHAVAASVNDFIAYDYVENNNTPVPGRLHVPVEYATDPTTPRPLILFLHGSGESGTNNLAQINGNIDNLLTAAKARSAFLYAPQVTSGWVSPLGFSRVMTMIDRAIAEHNVDPHRIYVTGLSLGGGGVWNFLNQFPDRVAAAVPICGVGPTSSFQPANIVDEPVWAFHSRNDTNVPVAVTRSIINSLLAEAGQPIPTTYPTNNFGPIVQFDFPPLDLHYTDMRGGHGIWPQVYNTPALYDWMFAHGAVPEPGTLALGLIGLVVWSCRRCKLG